MFFCLAVNMLELEDLRSILRHIDSQSSVLSLHDRAEQLERQLRECAELKDIPLELRPW